MSYSEAQVQAAFDLIRTSNAAEFARRVQTDAGAEGPGVFGPPAATGSAAVAAKARAVHLMMLAFLLRDELTRPQKTGQPPSP
jgi:hypothetical protein